MHTIPSTRALRSAALPAPEGPQPLERMAVDAHIAQASCGVTIALDWLRDRATIRTTDGGIILAGAEGCALLDEIYALWERADITVAEAAALAAAPIIEARAAQVAA